MILFPVLPKTLSEVNLVEISLLQSTSGFPTSGLIALVASFGMSL